MEGSGTQCKDSWSRNSGVRERCLQSPGSTQSFSHGRDPDVWWRCEGASCFCGYSLVMLSQRSLALLGSSTETLSLNWLHGHYPFGWSEKTINASQPPRRVVRGGTDMKTCSYFSKECWEWIVLWWSSKSQIPRKTGMCTAIGPSKTWVPKVGFSTKGVG